MITKSQMAVEPNLLTLRAYARAGATLIVVDIGDNVQWREIPVGKNPTVTALDALDTYRFSPLSDGASRTIDAQF